MSVQFQGESPWDAIVDDNCLDIVEEQHFRDYILGHNLKPDELDLEKLEALYRDWEKLDAGLDDVAEGRTRPVSEVRAEIKSANDLSN